jgi:ABC-type xylose transport system permease subunit
MHIFTAAPPGDQSKSRDIIEAASIASFIGVVVGLIIGAILTYLYAYIKFQPRS